MDDDFYLDLDISKKFVLCKYLRSFPLEVLKVNDFSSSQITIGGLSLKEIDTNSMESKKVDGLYITGEL